MKPFPERIGWVGLDDSYGAKYVMKERGVYTVERRGEGEYMVGIS